MRKFSDEAIEAKAAEMKAHYAGDDGFAKVTDEMYTYWAQQELETRWRRERHYDHTVVAMSEPGSIGYDPDRPSAEIQACSAADGGQVWVTRLTIAELRELAGQIADLLKEVDAG